MPDFTMADILAAQTGDPSYFLGGRRSSNVEQPASTDPLWAMLMNPLRSQWETRDESGFTIPKTTIGNTAAEWPSFPPADPRFTNSQMARQLGIGDIERPSGQITAGNIDLNARPIVKNPDGSISTVRSMSFNDNGKEVLIPTVAADGSSILSDEAAIKQYRATGQHLGMFDTPDNATAYAKKLHEDQARQYVPAGDITPADVLQGAGTQPPQQ